MYGGTVIFDSLCMYICLCVCFFVFYTLLTFVVNKITIMINAIY